MKILNKTINSVCCLILLLAFSGCCKKIVPLLGIEFKDFDFSSMDSVMVIQTERSNLESHIDTTFQDPSRAHTIAIPISDKEEENASYIIKCRTPRFEHTITEIKPIKRRVSSCGQKLKWTLRWDGQFLDKNESNIITVTP